MKHLHICFLRNLFFGVLILGSLMVPSFAQEISYVTEVRVEGSARIDPETIRSYLTIKAGERITPKKMDESLKKLFSTGFFKDVVVKKIGKALIGIYSSNIDNIYNNLEIYNFKYIKINENDLLYEYLI